MGAKQSVEKKEVAEGIAGRGRVHQYEEIDDDELVENQAKLKESSQNVATGLPEHLKDLPAADNQVQCETTPEATVISPTSSAQTKTTNSPQVNKRYHPYDEIPDDKFSSSQKSAVNGKEDVKQKSKDNSNGIFGGKKIGKEKKKDKKKHSDLVACQIMDQEASMKTTQSDQSGTNTPDPLYNEIGESGPGTGEAATKMGKKEISKSNDELNKQERTAQNVKAFTNNTAGQISPVRKPKAAPRYHLYTEISDRKLTSSQEDVLKGKKDENSKDRSSNQKMRGETDENVDQRTSEPGSKLTAGAANTNMNSPLNASTSNESLRETGVPNMGANLYNKGDNQIGRYTETGENNENETFEDSEPVEYLNVAACAAASNPQSEEDQNNGMDVYAVPQKVKAKPRCQKPLNYIEVEFNPSAPRAEISQPYTPTNYCNVVSKDGKIILQES